MSINIPLTIPRKYATGEGNGGSGGSESLSKLPREKHQDRPIAKRSANYGELRSRLLGLPIAFSSPMNDE
jgi:hypothetical protein